MHRPRHGLLVAGSTLLALGLSGCAAGGNRTTTLRPSAGGLPTIQPGVPVSPHSSSQMLIQPGAGGSPTPAFPSSPSIQPGPSLPDASFRKWPTPYPESASTRGGRGGAALPDIAPRPDAGAPIARTPVPAALSGQIEIVPGPAIRALRPKVELLPPPPDNRSGVVEELPPPTR